MIRERHTLGQNEVVLLDETIEGVLCEIVNVAGSSQGCEGSKTERILHCEYAEDPDMGMRVPLVEVGCCKKRGRINGWRWQRTAKSLVDDKARGAAIQGP